MLSDNWEKFGWALMGILGIGIAVLFYYWLPFGAAINIVITLVIIISILGLLVFKAGLFKKQVKMLTTGKKEISPLEAIALRKQYYYNTHHKNVKIVKNHGNVEDGRYVKLTVWHPDGKLTTDLVPLQEGTDAVLEGRGQELNYEGGIKKQERWAMKRKMPAITEFEKAIENLREEDPEAFTEILKQHNLAVLSSSLTAPQQPQMPPPPPVPQEQPRYFWQRKGKPAEESEEEE